MTLTAQTENTVVPEALKEIFLPLSGEIKKLEVHLFELLNSQVPFVREVAHYVLRNGGKRMRPLLTVVSAKMSGFVGEASYNMGSCIEFIHTASLLHDDVIDHAKIRRGRPSANAKWGNHVSVLVGDFFYCRASQLLTAQGDLQILKTVTDCITALTEGEVLEIVTNADLNTSEEDYLNIIKNKTALLFSAACEVGGILGGVAPEFQKGLKDYGYYLGMAFQLADDVLDYISSEDVFGKVSGTDLKEGKLTLPLIKALKKASDAEAQTIKNALIAERADKEILVAVSDIIKKHDGYNQTYELAKDYIRNAKEALAPFRNSIEKEILLSVADYAIARDR